LGQLNTPAVAHRVGREAVRGLVAFERTLQDFGAPAGEFLLPRGESAVQGKKEIPKARGQIARGIELGRRAADWVDEHSRFRWSNCGGRHGPELLLRVCSIGGTLIRNTGGS